MQKLILPKRVICEHNVDNSNNLLIAKTVQINLNEKQITAFKKGSYIVLDFGKEIPGGIRILTSQIDSKYTNIHVRFGESVGECMSTLGYKNSTNDHSPRDFYYTISFLSDLTFGNTGFRFVRIDLEEDTVITIKNIYAVCDDIKPIQGYFKSDDKLLDDIFSTAAYTNAVCLRNGLYWDGIKRDRLCWIGDSYPIYKACKYLYQNNDELIKSLEVSMEECPLPEWINFSPMYSMWWLLLLCEYHLDNQDFAKIEHLFTFFKSTIYQASNFVHPNGDISFPFLFIDWPSHYDINDPLGNDLTKKEDEVVGCRFLCLITFRKCLLTFEKYLSFKDISLIKQMIEYLEKGDTNVIKFKQIAALGVEANIIDDNKRNILLSGGANGLSTFQSYFILKAINLLDDKQEALTQLKQYYGEMLDLGATTFFEDFDISWAQDVTKIDELPNDSQKDFHGDHGSFCYKGYRHSLCHGWSSGVIAYIFEYIVGVNQINPTHYVIKPNTLTINNIKCGFETKYGLVELVIVDNKVISIKHPDELKIEII